MHRRIPHLASRLPIVALLSLSCATLGRLAFTEPDVELQEIAVTGIGLTGGTFELAFDVYNPNDYRIRSTRLEVGIDLDGTHFGDALLDRPLDLSPTNHSRIVVPGRVLLDTPLGEKTVALHGTGNVPLRKLIR